MPRRGCEEFNDPGSRSHQTGYMVVEGGGFEIGLSQPLAFVTCVRSGALGFFSPHRFSPEFCSHRDDVVEGIFCFRQHASIPGLAWPYPDHRRGFLEQPRQRLNRNQSSVDATCHASERCSICAARYPRANNHAPFFFARRIRCTYVEMSPRAGELHAAVVGRTAGVVPRARDRVAGQSRISKEEPVKKSSSRGISFTSIAIFFHRQIPRALRIAFFLSVCRRGVSVFGLFVVFSL